MNPIQPFYKVLYFIFQVDGPIVEKNEKNDKLAISTVGTTISKLKSEFDQNQNHSSANQQQQQISNNHPVDSSSTKEKNQQNQIGKTKKNKIK